MERGVGKYHSAVQRWAGIGPYYAMFPSAFCDSVIERYCARGGTVLDPFAGRGTSLYSAATAGRSALGIEINPVGWVYSRAKLNPANRKDVELRLKKIYNSSSRYTEAARRLPLFFKRCYTPEVRAFLLSARDKLDWRHDTVDRTLMALLLVHLHGKSSDSFSNQMRQTKAMSPQYAVKWWRKRGMAPPKVDILDFLNKKLNWRYAKGVPETNESRAYLGDSLRLLPALEESVDFRKIRRPSLMLTSPPYFKITNYHYDQWLRLWLLGGPPTDRRTPVRYRGKHRDKFQNLPAYRRLLIGVFERAARLLTPDAIIYVRTDCREPTLSITRQSLKAAFPMHRLRQIKRPVQGKTQTRLFGNGDPRAGEVDLILAR